MNDVLFNMLSGSLAVLMGCLFLLFKESCAVSWFESVQAVERWRGRPLDDFRLYTVVLAWAFITFGIALFAIGLLFFIL